MCQFYDTERSLYDNKRQVNKSALFKVKYKIFHWMISWSVKLPFNKMFDKYTRAVKIIKTNMKYNIVNLDEL